MRAQIRHNNISINIMGFAVRVRSGGQKYGPTCHQRDRADVTEFVTLVRLSSLGQHVGVLALARYKRRKSAPTAGTIGIILILNVGNLWGPVGHDTTRDTLYRNYVKPASLCVCVCGPINIPQHLTLLTCILAAMRRCQNVLFYHEFIGRNGYWKRTLL